MGVPNGRLKSKKWQKSQKEDVMEGIGEPSAGVFLTTRSAVARRWCDRRSCSEGVMMAGALWAAEEQITQIRS